MLRAWQDQSHRLWIHYMNDPDLDHLLSAALRQSRRDKIRADTKRAIASKISAETQDYAQRLAEKALYRRLLANEELDGARFRWLYKHSLGGSDRHRGIDDWRAWIDSIMLDEAPRAETP